MGLLSALIGGGNVRGIVGGGLEKGLLGGISDAITNASSVGDGFKRFGKGLLGGLGNMLGINFGLEDDEQKSEVEESQGNANQLSLSDLASLGLQYDSSQLGDLISKGLDKMQGVSNAGVAADPQQAAMAQAAAAQASNLPEGAAMIDNGVGNQVVLDPTQAARKKMVI